VLVILVRQALQGMSERGITIQRFAKLIDHLNVARRLMDDTGACYAEYDIASLFVVSFYCFVTKACARRPGAAASVERRRRERRTRQILAHAHSLVL
jgi:hypothetical protein